MFDFCAFISWLLFVCVSVFVYLVFSNTKILDTVGHSGGLWHEF